MDTYEQILAADIGDHPLSLGGAYAYFVDDDGQPEEREKKGTEGSVCAKSEKWWYEANES